MTDHGYIPAGHLIWINRHRQGGTPCLLGTRIPAAMIAEQVWTALEAWTALEFASREKVKVEYPVTDEQIDAALAWYADPDHWRITRNAIRRQRYAERRSHATIRICRRRDCDD